MIRALFLSATLYCAAPVVFAQPTQDEIAEARLQYIDGNYEAALAVLMPAAEAGDANAQNIVADAYDAGNGLDVDPAKAVEWWEKSAAQDFPKALHNLGLFYEDTDPEKARGYYERSIAFENAGSMANLGWMYESGQLGDPPDYEKAAELYERADALGDTTATNNLGVLYLAANGVPEDLAYAFDLFWDAAEKGDLLGLKNVGTMYVNGYAVRKDPITAMALYRMSARRGGARGAIVLAYNLIEMNNALRDPAQGWAWCQIGLSRADEDKRAEYQEDCDYLAEQIDAETMAAGEAMIPEMTQ